MRFVTHIILLIIGIAEKVCGRVWPADDQEHEYQ